MKENKSIPEQNGETQKLLLLSALAITLFMALPRLAVIIFLKTKAHPGGQNITWWSFWLKCLYSFAIALFFLWVNVKRQKILTKAGMLDMTRFSHRLIINVILFFTIRFISLGLDLHIPSVAINENLYSFIFNITLVLEISICILVAEVYTLIVTNQRIRLRNETLQKVNAETTFEVLKRQVNPHFLFNSLNTLNAMIDSNSEAAKAFINNMSHVYRHVLNCADKPVVTLAEEMEFAMAYTNMLQERHIGSLHVTVNVSNQHMADFIPPMSLQILLENAVKHNVVSVRQPLEVIIETKNNYLIVNNRIQEKKVKPPSTGTGLYNLNRRYIYLCKKEIDISRSGSHFTVSLPLLRW